MTQDNTESGIVFRRMVIGGTVGFLLGFMVGMFINPPFPGMTTTSSDVQGLIYFMWFALGIIGGVVGTVLGVIDFQSFLAEKKKKKYKKK